ncbi:MAG: sulfatase [Acidobacteriota bacterium]
MDRTLTTRRQRVPKPGSSRSRSLALCALVLLTLGLLSCTPPENETSPRSLSGAAQGYNVLLLSVDTLRADRLGSYGYDRWETSPAMDSLLERGARFAEAQAPRASTWPSLATVHTGLFPSKHGLIYNGYSFGDDQVTLSTTLQNKGYETAAFLSNMCKANHQAWDTFFCSGGVDRRVNRRASDWLANRADPDRPFLLWTHYWGPHSPYYNGGERAQVMNPGYEGELAPKKGVLDRVVIERRELDEADLTHLDAIYAAAVRGTDDYVAGLLDALEAAGELEQTLIVFVADHGEDLWQHNKYLYHSCSVYQSSLHVPLGFAAPGLIEPSVIEQPVALVDVLPTILDLLGLEAPDCQHGASLVPYLEQPEGGLSERPAFSEYGDTRIQTVLHEGWKLVDNPDDLTPECMLNAPLDLYPIAAVELYDLASDPSEQTNLASSHPERVESLRRVLETKKAMLCTPGTAKETQLLSEELKEELRALGYNPE